MSTVQVDASTSTSASSVSRVTRASTPATELSEATDELLPLVESEETRRRREQTDRASAEIGRRLLQGWTMLGDECPRNECYYVPLVRAPKTGGETNPKKVHNFKKIEPHLDAISDAIKGMCSM